MSSKFIVQHRRGTAQQWAESGVIPYDGEIVIEECADVSIAMAQAMEILEVEDTQYKQKIKEKLDRMLKRLEED